MELLSATDFQFGTFPVMQVWMGGNLTWSRSGIYWTGLGSDNNWNTDENWSVLNSPVAFSSFRFAGTTRLTAYNDFPIDTPFNGIAFDSNSGMFQLSGNRFIFNAGEIKNNSVNTQTIRNDIKLSPTTNTFNCNVGNITIMGVLSGSGSLNKTGNSVLTLNPASTNLYTGKTVISNGTLRTIGSNKISDSSSVDVASNSIFRIGGTETIASIEGAGSIDLDGYNLTISSNSDTTFVGLLSNSAGVFTKLGTGTQTLGGTTTLGGTVQLRAGTLLISSGTHIQTTPALPRNFQLSLPGGSVSTLTISGGSLTTTGLFMGENGGGTSTVNCNGGILQVNGQTWQSGVSSTLNINGGTFNSQSLDLGGGSGTTTSLVNLNSGVMTLVSFLRWGIVGGATSTSTFNLNGGTFNCSAFFSRYGGTNTFNFNGGTFVAPFNVTLPTPFNYIVQSGGANFSVNSGITLTTGGLSDGGGGGGVTKLGPGVLALNGTLTYTGATSILNGSVRSIRTNEGTSPGTVTGTATFTNTTLSVSFNVAPSVGMTFKFFPASTTQSYPAVSLIGAPGRTASYNSTNSTLTIDS